MGECRVDRNEGIAFAVGQRQTEAGMLERLRPLQRQFFGPKVGGDVARDPEQSDRTVLGIPQRAGSGQPGALTLRRGPSFPKRQYAVIGEHPAILPDHFGRPFGRHQGRVVETQNVLGLLAESPGARRIAELVTAVQILHQHRVGRGLGQRVQQPQRAQFLRLGLRILAGERQPRLLAQHRRRSARQHPGQQARHRDPGQTRRRVHEHLRLIELCDQKPVAARHLPNHSQRRHPAVVHALGHLVRRHLAARDLNREHVRAGQRQPQLCGRTGPVT